MIPSDTKATITIWLFSIALERSTILSSVNHLFRLGPSIVWETLAAFFTTPIWGWSSIPRRREITVAHQRREIYVRNGIAGWPHTTPVLSCFCVSINGGYPNSWMAYFMENPKITDD